MLALRFFAQARIVARRLTGRTAWMETAELGFAGSAPPQTSTLAQLSDCTISCCVVIVIAIASIRRSRHNKAHCV